MSYILIVLGIVSRLLPHWPNFVPIGSIGIFQSNRHGIFKGALSVLVIMLITDIFLGFSFASIFVYVGMLSYLFWGQMSKKGWWAVPVAAVGGSVSFFIVSNFGVWLGEWYTHDLTGLVSCFVAAIPFYKFTLFSDIIFTTALFGLAALIKKFNIKEALWHTKLPKISLNKK